MKRKIIYSLIWICTFLMLISLKYLRDVDTYKQAEFYDHTLVETILDRNSRFELEIFESNNLSAYIPGDCVLLGTSNNNIYYSDYKIPNNDVDSPTMNFNVLEDYASNPVNKLLYSFNNYTYWSFCSVQNDTIYFAPVNVIDDTFTFQIIAIDNNGNELKISDMIESKSAPYIFSLNNYIVMTYVTIDGSVIEYIELDEGERKLIANTFFKIETSGSITGDFILYSGSLDDCGFYYEVVTLNNEFLEEQGIVKVYYYSIEKQKTFFIYATNKKSLFITGDKNIMLSSQYELLDPTITTGVLYTKINNKYYSAKIREIQPGFDLLGASRIDNGYIAAYNNSNIFLIDPENMNYEVFNYISYDDSTEKNSNIVFDKGNIFYLNFYENNIKLIRVNVK